MVAVLTEQISYRDQPAAQPTTRLAPLVDVAAPPATSGTFVARRVMVAAVALTVVVLATMMAQAVIASVIPQAPSTQPAVVETAAGTGIGQTGAALNSSYVVVQPGDTLWSIARSVQPKGDVRPLVQRLSELNGGAALQVGQALYLP
ncbi:MAG: LysM domain-containing protein [Actinomycetota bacterium]|jgi:LysM repeat protein|nr:LysM domain-containing protein [Actinomycetota bacterium]